MNRKAKEMNDKGKGHGVTDLGNNNFRVVSSTSGRTYRVWVHAYGTNQMACKCNCRWGYYTGSRGRRVVCSHVLAVQQYLAGQKTVSAWSSQQDAERQRRPMLDLGQGVTITVR